MRRREDFLTQAESRVYLTLDDGTEVDVTEDVESFELRGRAGHGPLSVRLTMDAELDLTSSARDQ